MAAIWTQGIVVAVAAAAFVAFVLVKWRDDPEEEDGDASAPKRLDGFDRVFACFKVIKKVFFALF